MTRVKLLLGLEKEGTKMLNGRYHSTSRDMLGYSVCTPSSFVENITVPIFQFSNCSSRLVLRRQKNIQSTIA